MLVGVGWGGKRICRRRNPITSEESEEVPFEMNYLRFANVDRVGVDRIRRRAIAKKNRAGLREWLRSVQH